MKSLGVRRDNLVKMLDLLERHDDVDELARDEHRRYALYLDALTAVPPDREREVLAVVLEDPDVTMRESAVAVHIDRSAARRVDAADFSLWYESFRDLFAESPFVRRRGDEWLIAKELQAG